MGQYFDPYEGWSSGRGDYCDAVTWSDPHSRCWKWNESHSVVSDSLPPHGLYSLWNSPGKNIGAGCHSLLQGIFLSQELNLGLLHCRQILYQLSYEGSPTLGVKGMENPWTQFLFTFGIILLNEVQVALSPEHRGCISSEQIYLPNYGFLRVIL